MTKTNAIRQKESETNEPSTLPQPVAQTQEESPWLGLRGLYADIPDEVYAAYLECIAELRDERDWEDANAGAVK